MAEITGIAGKKRGVLFTVSVLLLAISLVSLAIILSGQSAKSKRTVVGIMDIDRVSDQYSNMEGQLSKILSSRINVSSKGNEITFNESLPLPSQLAQDLDRFAAFESEYSDLNMSMELAELENATFMIMPNGIEVAHETGAFYIRPSDTPESAGAVQHYDLNITYPAASVDNAVWQSISYSSNGSADAVWVHVRVRDASFAFMNDFYATLDKYSNSYLNITQGGVQVGFVQFSSPAAAQVNYSGNIGLKASIGLANQAHVEANDTISVLASANRTGRVRIA